MTTKFRFFIALAILCTISSPSYADQKSHRKVAEDLLNSMGIEQQLQSSINQMLDLQIKANPQIAPFKEVMLQFLNKHMSWSGIKEDMITIYAEAFDERELKQIIAFYQTPTGKKMLEKNPELMSKSMQLGAGRVQANQAELQQMIQAEAKRKAETNQ